MLVELAVADSYAIAWEFTKDQAAPNDLSSYRQHPKYADLRPGCYTDDTQRSIANARVLLQEQPFNGAAYADLYVSTYRLDPRAGYSKRFGALLASCSDGAELVRAVDRSATSNGSLMGSLPLGFLPVPGEVALAATVQAATTHSALTAPYAQAMALSAHYFLYGRGRPEGLLDFLHYTVAWPTKIDLSAPWQSRVSMEAEATARAVLWLVSTATGLAETLRRAVDLGGDTDSVAALAVGISSLNPAVAQDLPTALIEGLEDGAYGRTFLQNLEASLRTRFGLAA